MPAAPALCQIYLTLQPGQTCLLLVLISPSTPTLGSSSWQPHCAHLTARCGAQMRAGPPGTRRAPCTSRRRQQRPQTPRQQPAQRSWAAQRQGQTHQTRRAAARREDPRGCPATSWETWPAPGPASPASRCCFWCHWPMLCFPAPAQWCVALRQVPKCSNEEGGRQVLDSQRMSSIFLEHLASTGPNQPRFKVLLWCHWRTA